MSATVFSRVQPHHPHDVITDVKATYEKITDTPSVFVAPRTKVTTILYNPGSTDSMLAAACLLAIDKTTPAMQLTSYNRFDGLDFLKPMDRLVVVGVELTNIDVKKVLDLVTAKKLTAVFYVYEDQYKRDPAIFKRLTEECEFNRPDQEYLSADEMVRDNTMCRVVRFKHGEAKTRILPVFTEWQNKVASYTAGTRDHLDYKKIPIKQMPRYNDHDHYKARNVTVTGIINNMMLNKVAVHSLRSMLSVCLTHAKPLLMLNNNKTLEINDTAIQQHRGVMQSIRVNIHKNLRKEYLGSSWFSTKKAILVAIMSVPENLYHDTMTEVRRTNDVFLGYEDAKTFRVYRISADDWRRREAVAKRLKPKDIWTEGNILCVATELPGAVSSMA